MTCPFRNPFLDGKTPSWEKDQHLQRSQKLTESVPFRCNVGIAAISTILAIFAIVAISAISAIFAISIKQEAEWLS